MKIVLDWFNEEQLEKYRIQDMVLKEVYNTGKVIVFKGGTALQRIYGLDRFSEDLDFDLRLEDIVEIDRALEDLDSNIIKVENAWEEEIIRKSYMYVYPLDFYSKTLNKTITLKIDAMFEECIMEPRKKSVILGESPAIIYVMHEVEILAEKVMAIINENRNQPRDLYDLRFLLAGGVPIDKHLIFLKSQSSQFGYKHKYSLKRFEDRVSSLENKWEELGPYVKMLPKFRETADYVLGKFRLT
ncbi:MAG: nucleotidyl transferase AbiEii/AbiGii toxin family protein [Candidatus Marsarchaeota archaeon]|nr:nucleotidyl transferase AbiEii/AbiGii toxin family protein [Candidatus Marsarchaeota archaeon]MCL5413173.1 nucleotidyl transferase AbiEii/AbiGii toxin family protein [Candidatus Marsarchaeota archaeon]